MLVLVLIPGIELKLKAKPLAGIWLYQTAAFRGDEDCRSNVYGQNLGKNGLKPIA